MRRIAVVTTSRADYGHLHWVLRELEGHPEIELRLIALGAQLAPEFGCAVREIERDGLPVHERLECLLSSDTDVGMAKTIGVATLGLADVLGRLRPDLLLLIADRYEMLAPAAVALALRIPIAHIEGGDVSEGAIDEAVRNALTKLSHLHFTPTATARRRVIGMGEEPWRVHHVGAPSLDHLRRRPRMPHDQLVRELGFAVPPETVVVAYHPVTLARDTLCETAALFGALERLERPIVFCFPNADAGSRALIERAQRFCGDRPQSRVVINLHPTLYWELLHGVAVLVGNSSSGIMETGSVPLPTVNVGIRQQGRERPRNVVDCPAEPDAIRAAVRIALERGFRDALVGMQNPYGDGHAADRIVTVLAATPIDMRLLRKPAVPPCEQTGLGSDSSPPANQPGPS